MTGANSRNFSISRGVVREHSHHPFTSDTEFDERGASYDRWFRLKVQASRDDPRRRIPDDEAMTHIREKMAAKRADKKTEWFPRSVVTERRFKVDNQARAHNSKLASQATKTLAVAIHFDTACGRCLAQLEAFTLVHVSHQSSTLNGTGAPAVRS